MIGVLKEPLQKTVPLGLPKPKGYIPFEPATPDIGIHPYRCTHLIVERCVYKNVNMKTGKRERERNNLNVHQQEIS